MSPPRIRLCLRPQRSFFGWFFFLVAAIVASGPTCSAEEGMITAVRHHQTLASTNDKKRRMCDRGALHKVLGVVAFVFNLFFRLEHKRESVSNFRQPEKKPATSTRRGSNNRRIVYRQNNRHHHERAITTTRPSWSRFRLRCFWSNIGTGTTFPQ